jgi:hypothetical protein
MEEVDTLKQIRYATSSEKYLLAERCRRAGVAFVHQHGTRAAMQLAQAIVPLEGLAKCS